MGLAYVRARELAAEMNKPEAIRTARDLFCIGTVADMAPLTGANRVLLKDGCNIFTAVAVPVFKLFSNWPVLEIGHSELTTLVFNWRPESTRWVALVNRHSSSIC